MLLGALLSELTYPSWLCVTKLVVSNYTQVSEHCWRKWQLWWLVLDGFMASGFSRSVVLFSASLNLHGQQPLPLSICLMISSFFLLCEDNHYIESWLMNPTFHQIFLPPYLKAQWKSLSLVWLLLPHGLYSSWNSPGQNTGVGSLSLLQGIVSTKGSNPGLLHCRRILYQLSHKGSPRILEWVAYPSSSGSSQPRNRTRVSCIAGRSLPTELSGKPQSL